MTTFDGSTALYGCVDAYPRREDVRFILKTGAITDAGVMDDDVLTDNNAQADFVQRTVDLGVHVGRFSYVQISIILFGFQYLLTILFRLITQVECGADELGRAYADKVVEYVIAIFVGGVIHVVGFPYDDAVLTFAVNNGEVIVFTENQIVPVVTEEA